MSMTNEQIQALKAADHKRIAACVKACEGISTENLINNVPLKQGLAGLNKRIRDAEARRDQLLAERDADKALIAEQEKRIAELEQRHCGGALMEREEHHVGVVNKLLERIAELEARTLTVKLPRDITHVTNKYFEEGRDAVLEAIESQLAAAGITLVVEE